MWHLLAIMFFARMLGKNDDPDGRPTLAFAALEKRPSRLPTYLCISVFLHFTIGYVLLNIGVLLPRWPEDTLSRRLLAARSTPLVIRIPERSYYPADLVDRRRVLKPKSIRPSALPAATAASDPSTSRTVRRLARGAILLQPAKPAAERPLQPLPSFLHWAAGKLPRPVQPFAPGSRQPGKGTPLQLADPAMQAPNEEAAPGPVSLAHSDAKPNVATQATNSTPVRSPVPVEHTQASATEGQPLAAVSISPILPRGHEVVAIPPLIAPGSPEPDTGDTSVTHSDAAQPGPPSGQTGERMTAGLNPTAPQQTSPKSSDTAGDRDASAGEHTTGIVAVRTLDTRAGRVEVREMANGSQEWRYPPTGQFDVVIVQASPGELVPAAEHLITGRPVQTVYLAVGAGREWILQYCLPGAAAGGATQSGMVVSLAAPAKLEAPWVQTAALPPHSSAPAGRSSVYYGILGANGKLHSLRTVETPDYHARADLVPYLERWEFRPARRDGTPVEVEILLIVPAGAGV